MNGRRFVGPQNVESRVRKLWFSRLPRVQPSSFGLFTIYAGKPVGSQFGPMVCKHPERHTVCDFGTCTIYLSRRLGLGRVPTSVSKPAEALELVNKLKANGMHIFCTNISGGNFRLPSKTFC